jgi:Protein of unknown function (DUF4242)
MKTRPTILGAILLLSAAAAGAQDAASTPLATWATNPSGTHRFVVERTFSPGALDGLDSTVKAKVNANNNKFGVHWVMSYANAAKTKTYCIYEGPSEAAIRKAAASNSLPIDSITEVPVTLLPK